MNKSMKINEITKQNGQMPRKTHNTINDSREKWKPKYIFNK